MTKRPYTQLVLALKAFAKRNDLDIDSALVEALKRCKSANRPAAGESMFMQWQIIKGRCVHFFVPGKDFCDWLVDCVRDLSKEHMDALQDLAGGRERVGVIHFPTGEGLFSCAFGMPDHICKPGRSDFVSLFVSKTLTQDINCVYALTEDVNAKNKEDPEVDYYVRLLVGLGMYCNCFPEVIKPGPPEDIKHPSMHAYPMSKSIGIANTIVHNNTHASPTAHFRRGHFRVLSSPRFTHKRFQAVFVRETFVGQSVTVLSPEQTHA